MMEGRKFSSLLIDIRLLNEIKAIGPCCEPKPQLMMVEDMIARLRSLVLPRMARILTPGSLSFFGEKVLNC
jgi:hypothetical protein